jgi:hypothetical protein
VVFDELWTPYHIEAKTALDLEVFGDATEKIFNDEVCQVLAHALFDSSSSPSIIAPPGDRQFKPKTLMMGLAFVVLSLIGFLFTLKIDELAPAPPGEGLSLPWLFVKGLMVVGVGVGIWLCGKSRPKG